MIDFTNIKTHAIDRPEGWSSLGAAEDFDTLSDEFKDQIIFLDKSAGEFLYKFFSASGFHTGPFWEPFDKKNFKHIEKVNVTHNKAALKKWLYQRGLPFSKWVYVLPNFGGHPLAMTWKMVIKLCDNLFFADDIVIFDETIQWCLSYWHEDEMYFGKINTTSPEAGYKEVQAMNEKEKKYPGYKHPLKGPDEKKGG